MCWNYQGGGRATITITNIVEDHHYAEHATGRDLHVIAVLDHHRSLVTVSYVPESQNPAPDYLPESRRQRNLQKSTSQWVLQIHLHKSTNPFARSNMLADFCPAEYAADLKSLSYHLPGASRQRQTHIR